IKILNRADDSGTVLAELVWRHLPPEHRAVMIEREVVRGLRRSAQADDYLFRKARHHALKILYDVLLNRCLVRAPVVYGTVVNVCEFLDDDDMAAGRGHRRLVQSRHENLEGVSR